MCFITRFFFFFKKHLSLLGWPKVLYLKLLRNVLLADRLLPGRWGVHWRPLLLLLPPLLLLHLRLRLRTASPVGEWRAVGWEWSEAPPRPRFPSPGRGRSHPLSSWSPRPRKEPQCFDGWDHWKPKKYCHRFDTESLIISRKVWSPDQTFHAFKAPISLDRHF